MNGKSYTMDRVYKVLMNSPELTDADLKNLPMGKIGLRTEEIAGELLVIYEKLGEAQKRNVMNFAERCLKEEGSSIA